MADTQPAVAAAAEARPVAPAAAEAEQAQPVVAPVVAVEEGRRAPVVVGARPEAMTMAPRQAPVAAEAQVEAPAEVA
jgi:hypothetical protein